MRIQLDVRCIKCYGFMLIEAPVNIVEDPMSPASEGDKTMMLVCPVCGYIYQLTIMVHVPKK